jgi:hypothetical protein
VAARLRDHIQNNNIKVPFQSAYKEGHSTETALLRVQNDIICSLHGKDNVILLLLDLSAAFDTIDHDILSGRLQNHFGITEVALKWIRDYLGGRSMKIKINGTLSESFPMKYGVPQGSVLGPILFTLYTAPLVDIIQQHGVDFHLYADDTQLYIRVTNDSIDASKSEVENCVKDIRLWMVENRLKLNDEKTELIVFRKRGTEILVNELEVGNAIIHHSPVVRNLGFQLDENLTMNDMYANCARQFTSTYATSAT